MFRKTKSSPGKSPSTPGDYSSPSKSSSSTPLLSTNILQQYDRHGLESTPSHTPFHSSNNTTDTTGATSTFSSSLYENGIIRIWKSWQFRILRKIHIWMAKISYWKHVNKVMVFNRKGQNIPSFSVFQFLLNLQKFEDLLFIGIVLILIVFSDHKVLSIRWKVLLVHVIWMCSLLWYDYHFLQMTTSLWTFCTKVLLSSEMKPSKSVGESSVPLTTPVLGVHRQVPASYGPMSLGQSDFSISTVRILQLQHTFAGEERSSSAEVEETEDHDDVFMIRSISLQSLKESPFIEALQQFQGNRNFIGDIGEEDGDQEGGHDEAHRSSSTRLSSRLQFQINIQVGTKRWQVWKTYRDCYKTYQCLVHSYPYVYIPKLSSWNKLHSFHVKEHRHYHSHGHHHDNSNADKEQEMKINKQNMKSFQSFQLLDAFNLHQTFSSTTSKQLEERDEKDKYLLQDADFLTLLQIELVNWLLSLRNCVDLKDDPVLRTFLNFPSPSPVAVATNSSGTPHPSSGIAMMPSRATTVDLKLETQDNVGNNASEKDVIFHDVLTPTTATASIASPAAGRGNKSSSPSSSPAKDQKAESTSSPAVDEIRTKYGLRYQGNTLDTFQFLDLDAKVQDMAKEGRFIHDYKVRGLKYKQDKQKQYPGPAIGRLLLLDLFSVTTSIFGDRHDHIATIGKVQQRLEIIYEVLGDDVFVLLLNIQIPGDPPVSLLCYFLIPKSFHITEESIAQGLITKEKIEDMKIAKKLFERYIDLPISEDADDYLPLTTAAAGGSGSVDEVEEDEFDIETRTLPSSNMRASLSKRISFQAVPPPKSWTSDIVWPSPGKDHPGILARDAFQNLRFKLIPQMLEAPWVVQMAVSSTPCILGQKIVQRYFRGHHYLEIDLHVGSSAIAQNVVSICRQYSKTFVCNLGVVIQGETEDELPEQVLCCTTINHMDLTAAEELKMM